MGTSLPERRATLNGKLAGAALATAGRRWLRGFQAGVVGSHLDQRVVLQVSDRIAHRLVTAGSGLTGGSSA